MVGFIVKSRSSAYFAKLGSGCVFAGGVCVCEELVYMCIGMGWLGCVRRVGMYWKGGEKRNYTIISYLLR